MLLVGLVVAASPRGGWADEEGAWPSFQGGPAHPGEARSLRAFPPLEAVRRISADGSGTQALSGAVLNGGIALACAETLVVAFDPSSGRELWRVARARGELIPPAIGSLGRHQLVVYTEGVGSRSAVAAADLVSRQRIWRVPLRQSVLSAPSIDAGRVFFGGRDGFVYSLDLGTGRVLWKTRTTGLVDTSPAVAQGRVLVVAENPTAGQDRLYSLAADSGKVQWSFARTVATDRPSSVTVAGGRAYVGLGDRAVWALDAGRGTALWSRPVRGAFSPYTAPAVSGGNLYVADADGSLYRIDTRTGRQIWEFQFPATDGRSSPLVAERFVFLGSSDGTLGAVDISTGHLVWKTRFDGEIGVLSPSGDVLLASVLARRGAIVALAPDPRSRLVDESSPTDLDLIVALASFAGAFVLVLAGVLGMFRLVGAVGSRSPSRRPSQAESRPADPRPDQEPGGS